MTSMDDGFSYTLEDEKIKKYMKLTAKEKLQWLEEINSFNEKVLTPKDKAIRAKFRAESN